MKRIVTFLLFFVFILANSQKIPSNRIQKTLKVQSDTLVFDKVSVSPFYFRLQNQLKKEIDSLKYEVDFPKASIYFSNNSFLNQQVTIEYEALPEFLTKVYQIYDESLIIDDPVNLSRLKRNKERKKEERTAIFEGLDTNGNLSRGITMGNNQDGVLSSNFDLQLKGKLSKKVSIKANITDNHVPLQENGYTQRLNEFDRVFIEMYSDKWKLKAGDIYFNDTSNYYMNFKKKVSGLSVAIDLGNKQRKGSVFSSGALVEGKYTEVDFNGLESNQGPYRLAQSSQQFLLIIANSEIVYVNGIPLQRGVDNDYVIDYNTSEVTFNTTYPIDSNMRIHVEFQASEENYTRFITFNKANFETEKLGIEVGFYNENDAKNQTLQQELNENQLGILANAGDDVSKMGALSAVREDYIENKIQYKKEIQNDIEIFVFSTDNNDEHYAVRFNYVGNNNGNYVIDNTIATGRVYKYVAPISSVKQGDYNPNITLISPEKLQIATLKAKYKPSDKTSVNTEIAYSNVDKNLFSSIDDTDNDGFAGKIKWKQLLIDNKWKLSSNLSYETIKENFNTIERIKNIEYSRDWNVLNQTGSQSTLNAGLSYGNDSIGVINYQLKKLNFGNFKGLKHQADANITYDETAIQTNVTFLQSNSDVEKSNYTTLNANVKQQFKSFWLATKIAIENNLRTNNLTQKLTTLSHKNSNYDALLGIGDSAKVNLELGYSFRTNDSIQNTELQNVSSSNTFYLKSHLIKKKHSELFVYLNFRKLNNTYFSNDESLNSRLNYRQDIAGNFISFNTVYETNSGVLPQQEFNYLQVDAGRGYYTWIDYNANEIQELDEFEIAQFQDQAMYVRVLLPTTDFIRTNLTKFTQSLSINPSQWSGSNGFKKWASHFSNQSYLQIENKKLKQGTFQFNPFDFDANLSLNYNLKNNLYLNRSKYWFSTTYSFFKSDNKTAFITGSQENDMQSNQLLFEHKIKKKWLLNLSVNRSKTISNHAIFLHRNYELDADKLIAKIGYSKSKDMEIEIHYNYKSKANSINNKESLLSNTFGTTFRYANDDKLNLHASFNYIDNEFVGNQFSSVGFQLLEGLKDGKNFTWDLILQKKLTKYLFVNLNYSARKSANSHAIHTGTVQLRANF